MYKLTGDSQSSILSQPRKINSPLRNPGKPSQPRKTFATPENLRNPGKPSLPRKNLATPENLRSPGKTSQPRKTFAAPEKPRNPGKPTLLFGSVAYNPAKKAYDMCFRGCEVGLWRFSGVAEGVPGLWRCSGIIAKVFRGSEGFPRGSGDWK